MISAGVSSHGWADPLVAGPMALGGAVFAFFLVWERRGARDPMLPRGLFGRANFAWGNAETVLLHGGLGLFFFVFVVFLQQVAGYGALEAGAATIPTTIVLLLLSERFGALAGRVGPRRLVAAGPLVTAAGVVYLLATVDESPDLLLDVLPGMTILALGLAIRDRRRRHHRRRRTRPRRLPDGARGGRGSARLGGAVGW